MTASGTAIEMAAERRRAAVLDGGSTRRCCHVSQERFLSMKLFPCARMISATSKGGRFTSSVASASV